MDKIVPQLQTKRCNICHTTKPLSDFYEHAECLFGVLGQCKSCYIARQLDKDYQRKRYIACSACGETDQQKFPHKPDGSRAGTRCKSCNYKSQKRFGISLMQREAMIARQRDVCAICGKPETSKHQSGTKRRLAIDHDHKTGMVRELLCGSCNQLLGMAHDDIPTLKKAIKYLKKHNKDAKEPQEESLQMTMF